MIFGQHLLLQELTLLPSTEHHPSFDGWLMARVADGVGYWLQHDVPASQLSAGDVFVATRVADGRLRASQLYPLKLQYFTVQPQHLEGLLTVVEWHRIETARHLPTQPVRFFKAADLVGQKFTRLASLSHTEKLPLRCALLQLWATATTDSLALDETPADEGNKLHARFWRLLSLMTRMEFCFSSAGELALRINCSERHFRGLFRKELGLSLHTYQASLRLDYERRPQREVPEETDMVEESVPCRPRRQPRRFSAPETKTDLSHAPQSGLGT